MKNKFFDGTFAPVLSLSLGAWTIGFNGVNHPFRSLIILIGTLFAGYLLNYIHEEWKNGKRT